MSAVRLLKPMADVISFLRYKADRLRLAKMMANGLRVGNDVYIMERVEFDSGYPFLISIGDNCRISKNVRILAHDATTFRDLGITRLAPVRILEGTFIGESVIILPGVTVGPRALIAAGSVVNRDIGEDAVAAGNPARPYAKFSALLMRYTEMARTGVVFKKEDVEAAKITREELCAAASAHEMVFLRGVPRKDPYYVNSDYNRMRAQALAAFNRLQSAVAATSAERPGRDLHDPTE